MASFRSVAVLVGLAAAAAGLVACGSDGERSEDGSVPEVVDTSEPGETAASEAVFADLDPDAPGCAAAASVAGEEVWAGGFGTADLDAGEPITEETVFDIGSTSKQFTATAILLLAEQGELDLDAPLSDVLEGLPPWADEVTLRQMLHHTSGIPDYIDLLYDEGFEDPDTTTDADALAALGEVDELDFEPGSAFEYSNSGYFLFSQVVEEVTGSTLEDYLAAEVLEPLALEAVVDPVAAIDGKAVSYVADGDSFEIADSRWEQVGDGGVQTTPSELVRWASEYWDPVVGGDEVLAARTDGAVEEEGTSRYGAGITIDQDDELGTVLSHSGSWAGFVADLVVLPDQQVAAAVTCNTPDALDPTDAAYELVQIWAG